MSGRGDGESDKAWAARLYQETELPAGEIGKLFGVSRQTIHSWMSQLGVPLRGPRTGSREITDDSLTPVEVAAMVAPNLPDSLAALRAEIAANGARLDAATARLAELTQAVSRLQGLLEASVGFRPPG